VPRVFISHSTKDRTFVEEQILPLLQTHGLRVWYCQDHLLPGKHLDQAIRAALEECEWFLVVVSKNSAASDGVQEEVDWALNHRRKEDRIIPICIDDTTPDALKLRFARLLYVDFRDVADARKKLLSTWGIAYSIKEGDFSEEALFQERYLATRLRGQIPSQSLNDYLMKFAGENDAVPCILQGRPGSGRAGLLAHFIQSFRKSRPSDLVLPYFINARLPSGGLPALLRRFCLALKFCFGLPEPIPVALADLKATFGKFIQVVPVADRVVMVIDDLDGLEDGTGMDWLPRTLPGHVKIVASCNCNKDGKPILATLNEGRYCLALDRFSMTNVRFDFVGPGQTAPAETFRSDRLFLDVGNALRAGVVDNHHLGSFARSTASLVLDCPHFVRDAVNSWRSETDPFTIVLHIHPDLDAATATYLALHYLREGEFPPAARILSNYVDRVDHGYPGMSTTNPFSLYAAHLQIGDRLSRTLQGEPLWREWMKQSLDTIHFVLRQFRAKAPCSILEIDAFGLADVFGPEDRQAVEQDVVRYRKKLELPASAARKVQLRLPGAMGDIKEVPALIVRDVQNPGDAERVMYFKDWARSEGFVATCVYHRDAGKGVPRAILSVDPRAEVMLEGLGKALEQAELEKRLKEHGRDARLFDAITGERLPDRPGYTNPDPWYDGRDHGYTIVDSPRDGTVLTADEIEATFLEFGRNKGRH
jgi:hypothetical protein